MKALTTIMLLILLGAAGTVCAGDARHEMKIVIEDDQPGEELRIELDSEALGFKLHELQVGETRSVVDGEGRPVLITRTEDGFTFDVEGRTIELPAMPAHGGEHERKHKFVMRRGGGPMHAPGDIMILSGAPIDAATQDAIRSLLQGAGHDGEVRFIDHPMPPGAEKRVRIVEKRVEKQED